MTWWAITIIVFAIVSLLAGLALLLDWFKPFKDATGVKIPLTTKEKVVVFFMTIMGLLGLAGLFLALDPPCVDKLRKNHR